MSQFFYFIFQPIVWLPIVGILAYLTYQNYKKLDKLTALNSESVLLALEIPKTNDKSELAAEQLFASLHGILRDAEELKNNKMVQEHLSFEIASVDGAIRFYVWMPKALQSFVEGQIYSQYPSVQIYEAQNDYVDKAETHNVIHTAEISVIENEALPIKTFDGFEVDPLAGITGTLAKLESTGDELWIQILTRPIADDWHKKSDSWIKKVKDGTLSFSFDLKWFLGLLEALWTPPEQGEKPAAKELGERDKTRISKAEEKATKLGYQVKVRLAYLGNNEGSARLQMQALTGTFKQFNSTNLNGFKMTKSSLDKASISSYRNREFFDEGYILNIQELASIWHLPHTNVETPNIVWASSKTAEPPAKLPMMTGDPAHDENISAFGLTNFRGVNHQFGMMRRDRSRHLYIIGQTGAGKSGTLELLALSDIYHNQGYAIIDPHGDFAQNNMRFIPEHRLKDVVYFNPSDTAFPLGFNPLEITDPNRKSNISSEVIGVLKRMFGDSWGPRLEYILRYSILALLDRPETTMLDITRILTDAEFRKDTLAYCKDISVLQFWKQEFGQWGEKQVNEAIAPVLNKVGAFTANPIIRNIIGQPKSPFNIRQIMDEGKILVVNLSKGLIGEDNAGILGSFLVTKIQLAAMSRSDIEKIEDRRPFYLYVDEFQNFATDSFAVILSEARKYGLNLTVANQYISQMTESVRDAVFGNVGSMISFRVSADDAPILGKQFEPQFEPQDLIQMNNRHFVMNMVINGEKTNAFSATTLTLPNPANDLTPKIIENTRRYYGRPRAEIEEDIRNILAPPKQFINKKMIEKQGLSPQSGWANSGVASGITPKTEKVFEPAKPMFAAPPKTKKKDFNPKKVSPNSMENQQPVNQLKDLNKILSESNPNGSEDSKASNANSNKRRRKPRARKSQNKPDFNKN
ncbi:MAG: type IV secretion system DNA-binding domain-containing protein [Candidatus Sacchiramonaceae bacterium]|nr:type IV secretion system DNA-binding domain-containing protein [Candidatus Saccharimonadaceae bacterium]